MNDTSLACFLSVARTGSFTTSAQELSSTQQAVSRNVLTLEEELGFSLLDRSGRTMTTTWEGERFLAWYMECERQTSLAVVAADRLVGRGTDTLRLGWSDWTGCPESIEADIRAFTRQYEGCTLDVRQGSVTEIQSFLDEDALDLAILPEYNSHHLTGVTVSDPFMDLPLYIVTSEETSRRFSFSGTPTPAELTPMKQLAASVGDGTQDQVSNRARFLCASFNVYPEHLEVMANVPSVMSELLCGPCYTIAPRTTAALRRGGLCFYPLDIVAPLVFVQPHASASPWTHLFRSFVSQREGQS
ncbi:MAG: LysR family transcriptional regulator [Oscillospiraceae bacterium]|nr:LysR family transcriptional regulator [Oscillospiraceae bacterium]